jgi:hypothetical protein
MIIHDDRDRFHLLALSNRALRILFPSSAARLPCLACDFTPLLGSELCQTSLAALASKFAQIF